MDMACVSNTGASFGKENISLKIPHDTKKIEKMKMFFQNSDKNVFALPPQSEVVLPEIHLEKENCMFKV